MFSMAMSVVLLCPQSESNQEWQLTSIKGAPSARTDETVVWTGREAIVWGGVDVDDAYCGDGAAYAPDSDTWRTISARGAPSARAWHAAVWTGREMLIFGGSADDRTLGDGAAYDPRADRWRRLSNTDAPKARSCHAAAWLGTEMLVWAGVSDERAFHSGGLYDPETDRWRRIEIASEEPAQRSLPIVWTGEFLLAFGGINGSAFLGHGVVWNRDASVRLMPESDAPSARAHHAAVWTGSEFVVWGGKGRGTVHADGARFDPKANRWKPMESESAPTARWGHAYLWRDGELWIFGGGTERDSDLLRDVWAWHPENGRQSRVSLPEPRADAHAFQTGRGLLVVGGRDGKGARAGGFFLGR